MSGAIGRRSLLAAGGAAALVPWLPARAGRFLGRWCG